MGWSGCGFGSKPFEEGTPLRFAIRSGELDTFSKCWNRCSVHCLTLLLGEVHLNSPSKVFLVAPSEMAAPNHRLRSDTESEGRAHQEPESRGAFWKQEKHHDQQNRNRRSKEAQGGDRFQERIHGISVPAPSWPLWIRASAIGTPLRYENGVAFPLMAFERRRITFGSGLRSCVGATSIRPARLLERFAAPSRVWIRICRPRKQ
jgi:hypothetical protein